MNRSQVRWAAGWIALVSLAPMNLQASTPGANSTKLPAGWVEEHPPLGPGAFAVQLAAQGEALLATWLEPLANGAHRVRFARYSGAGNGAGRPGGAWSAAVTVLESDRIFANWADTPGAAGAADGSVYAWWLEKSAAASEAYDVHLARAAAGAPGSFASLGIVHEDRSAVEHGFVSAVAEGSGIRLLFLDGRATARNGPTELRTVLVRGERIGVSAVVDDRVCDCCATAVVSAGAGEGAVVAYRDRTADEIRDVRVARIGPEGPKASTPASAGAPAAPADSVVVGDDRWRIEGCPVNGPALALSPARGAKGAGPELAVAWFTAPGDRARVAAAISSDGGRTFGPTRLLDDAKPLGRVAIAPLDASYLVAWLGRSGDSAELKLARLGGEGGTKAALPVARTSAGRGAGVPRLARAGDRLWIAWQEPEPRGLRFASASAAELSKD